MAALAPSERRAYVDTLDRFAGGDRTVSADPSPGELAAAQRDHELGADRGSHLSYLEAARGEARTLDAAMSAETESAPVHPEGTPGEDRGPRTDALAGAHPAEPEPVADPHTGTDLEPTVEAESAPEPAPAPDVDPSLTADAPTPEPSPHPRPAEAAQPEPEPEAPTGGRCVQVA